MSKTVDEICYLVIERSSPTFDCATTLIILMAGLQSSDVSKRGRRTSCNYWTIFLLHCANFKYLLLLRRKKVFAQTLCWFPCWSKPWQDNSMQPHGIFLAKPYSEWGPLISLNTLPLYISSLSNFIPIKVRPIVKYIWHEEH